ncbi:MAG: DUF4153 domain-containing protein [Lachnospiraceae bacterium]|nr:DUF4153 domain-containing protein [Lachnospiraceae bacterium]
MNFIREKSAFLFQKIKQSCSDYRVTVIAVELFTLYAVAGQIWDDLDLEYTSHVTDFLFEDWALLAFLALFILAAMLVESLFPYEKNQSNANIARILGFVIGAVPAAALVWGLRLEESEQFFHLSGDIVAEWCERFVLGYVLLLMIAIVYVCHRKSGVGFIEYILCVLVNYAIAIVIYFVLLLGVVLIIWIIDSLFLDGYSSLYAYGAILVTGVYYAPSCIMALNDLSNKKELNDRISIIVIKYVLSVMTICALAVVYIYLLKILIMREIPSNEIFRIVTGLFCIGMPIWILDYFYRDDTKYMCFLQKLPYGLIPLIPVQTYAIGVRIYHNGMTPGRYLGVCMIIFEVIMLFVWYFWKEKLERVLLILGAGVIIAIFIPGINMFSVSNRWQLAFLQTYYNKVLSQGELTQEEYDRLEGAYKYLKWEPQMKELVEQFDIYDDDFAGQLAASGIEGETLTQTQYHSIHCCQMVGDLDINDYSSFAMLNQDEAYDERGDSRLPVDFSAFRFYKRGSQEQETVVVDLSEFADRCMDYENEHPDAGQSEFSEAMKPYTEIAIDSDTVLYLNHFQISYKDGIENGEDYFEVTSVNISGMLLSR